MDAEVEAEGSVGAEMETGGKSDIFLDLRGSESESY